MKALVARQKLIRNTDRLDLRWQMVKTYESDELASRDEDVKHLEKIEKVARQKMEKKYRKLVVGTARSQAVRGSSQSSRDLDPQRALSISYDTGPVSKPPQFEKRTPGLC